jgi:hypothetical protein
VANLAPQQLGDRAGPRYAADERQILEEPPSGGPGTTTNRKNARDPWAANGVLG